jgi:translation initiation factor IF-3
LNDEIRAKEVRLVDENGEQKGIVSLAEALRAAESVELDLVEIVANAEPPVCKIMDFNKHLFDLKQKQKEAKKKQHQVQVKEIKLRPGTDVGDYNVKLRAITKFLEEGNKVKITFVSVVVKWRTNSLVWLNFKKLKQMWLKLVLLSNHQKWKVVKWVCCLVLKRKSNDPLILKKHCLCSAFFILLIDYAAVFSVVNFFCPIGIRHGAFSSGTIRCSWMVSKPFS